MGFNLPLSTPFSLETETQKKNLAFAIWLAITIFCVAQSLITHRFNNYLIFENTFRNLIHRQSLYAEYPQYHFDSNHYGPIFGLLIMPFALLPNWLGFLLWNLFNCIILFKAIESINIKRHSALYYIAIPCFVAASLSQQFNPAAGAFIILSYSLLNKNKGLWSTMLIVLGAFIKLYGIVGLAFFFFVEDKKRFIVYLLGWGLLFLVLPMLFSSPEFIWASYKEWVISLVHKNTNNIAEASTDISIMGFIRSIFLHHDIPNSVFLLSGLIIFGLPYLNIKAYTTKAFRLYMLASVLLFPVLFSTGSEDCTYIIAITGVGIWYIYAAKTALRNWLYAGIFIFSCDLPLLLFPKIADTYPILLSMLSFPFFIAWIVIIYKACMLKKEEQFGLSATIKTYKVLETL
jgi:hypothetical protein